ncbi:MAG TPA: alkaline phosphatase PhoX [Solirubrobacteraceae bacterium]|jgi:secreted PhoX family phosphatase|nr:alkaline phosphatase PhoX [Solirubrobacteraceae bacterium]
MEGLTRRHLMGRAALASGALALGPAFWRRAVASAATPGDGPYGPLGPPDANGIRLPVGFKARVVARGNELVPGTAYRFPVQPDGQATFATQDGGWILVTNSEFGPPDGGVSAIRFDASGKVVDAYRVLAGTALNCSGGPTPWGTWLSCEEHDAGNVWECDPTRASQGVRRPALGTFKHEAAAVDSAGQRLYLTEDYGDGNLYRFTPAAYPSLDAGRLEVAAVGPGGAVRWLAVPDPNPGPAATPTRRQVPDATRFDRAEGIWFDSGMVYVATTGDSKIHAYDTVSERIEVIYDRAKIANPPLQMPDNLSVAPSGDLFVAENHDAEDGHLDVILLTPDLVIAPFLSVEGPRHVYDNPVLGPSELTGPVFDPSGTRFYVTSQRARTTGGGSEPGPGEVYEITGPFRVQRPRSGPLSPGNPREAGQAIGSGQGRSPGAALVGAALGIEVPRRIGWDALRRAGLPVAMTVDGPAAVTIAVSARFTPAELRRRGVRRRRHRLARAERRFRGDGPRVVHVRFPARALALLRGRRTGLRLAVRVQVGEAAVTRTTVLDPQRPRRRPRRRSRRRAS